MRPFHTLTEQGKARRHRQTVVATLARYGIEPIELTQLAIDTNFVFGVHAADGERYALRIHRKQEDGQDLHDKLDTELECWWMQRLTADGLPVAPVITNQAGRTVTVIDGVEGVPDGQRCVLFGWLSGHKPDDRECWYWERLGRLTARLHQHAAGLRLPAWAEPRRWDTVFPYEYGRLGDGRYDGLLTVAQRSVLQQGIELLNPFLSAQYERPEPPRLIHGDLHDENVMSNKRRLSVFDFEDLIEGHPSHDLAVALYGPFYHRADFSEVAAAMRAGYEQVAPWPIRELEELHPLFAARALGLVNYCLALGPGYVGYVPMLTDRVGDFVARC